MKILFTGGGTGGHIFPIIAVAREMRRSHPKNLEIFYLGPKDPFAKILLSQEGIRVKSILSGKIRRYWNFISFFQNIFDILIKIPIGILQAFLYIFFLNPDSIFSKGGYGSIPVVIAGKLLGVPIFLHESDAVPGATNRFLARFALEIFVSFPRTIYFAPQKIILIGNPIRKEILEGSAEEAKEFFHIKGNRPVVLVLGGSQGAQRINDKILEILPKFLRDFELIHQCGEKNYNEVKKESKVMMGKELERYHHLFPFLKEYELKLAYAISDLIVARAGSGTIFEIAALGKPSILIPLPEAAQNHQLKNAYNYAKNGAAIVLEEKNFTPHFFLEKVRYLLSSPNELKKMSDAAKKFARPQAAKIIAEYLITFLTQH